MSACGSVVGERPGVTDEREGGEVESGHEQDAEERAAAAQELIAPRGAGEVLAQPLLAVVPNQARADAEGVSPRTLRVVGGRIGFHGAGSVARSGGVTRLR